MAVTKKVKVKGNVAVGKSGKPSTMSTQSTGLKTPNLTAKARFSTKES